MNNFTHLEIHGVLLPAFRCRSTLCPGFQHFGSQLLRRGIPDTLSYVDVATDTDNNTDARVNTIRTEKCEKRKHDFARREASATIIQNGGTRNRILINKAIGNDI